MQELEHPQVSGVSRVQDLFSDDIILQKLLEEREEQGPGGDQDGSLSELIETERNKIVGLDTENLKKIREEYGERYGKEKLETTYLPVIAMIERLLGEDMDGKTIVEIGTSREGFYTLNVFAEKGARTIAIDLNNPSPSTFTDFPEVEFHRGAWENITDILKDQKIDVVYVNYMYTFPEKGGRFEQVHPSQRREEFDAHITAGMDSLLNSGGLYINHNPSTIDSAYEGPFSTFEKLGYSKLSFVDPERFLKERPKAHPEIPKIGNIIKLYQKP